jgi:hypothetical protein
VHVLQRLGLGFLAIIVLALFTLNVAAWRGRLIDEEPEPALPDTTLSRPPRTSPEMPPPPRYDRPPSGTVAAPEAPTQPRELTVVVSATRGDCWVEARAGSASDTVLYTGVLAQGRSLRFNRPRVWLRLGAASNVDVVVDGRQSSVPPGTVELTLPAA